MNNSRKLTKRNVDLQLLHNRLGHRRTDSLLLGNNDDIWADITVKNDPESICTTCQITLSRRAARVKQRPAAYPTKPGVMAMADIIDNPFERGLTVKTHFPYYLLVVDVYSSFPVLLGLHSINTMSVLQAFDFYRSYFRPSYKDDTTNEIIIPSLLHIRADAGSQFNNAAFRNECATKGIQVTLAAPKHQEQNGLCERTWQSIRNLAFSYLNYARVGSEFGDMAFEHAWKVFAVLPIKDLYKEKSETCTTPYELFYGRKPSLRKFRVLFCPCVYKVYERTKSEKSKIVRRYNSSNHPQRGVIGVFVGIPRGQAGFLIWEPRSGKLHVSGDVTFDESFSSVGPRRHFAFQDALPVTQAIDVPDEALFQDSTHQDDHHGPPLTEYLDENNDHGYLLTATEGIPELDDIDSVEEPLIVEEPRVVEERTATLDELVNQEAATEALSTTEVAVTISPLDDSARPMISDGSLYTDPLAEVSPQTVLEPSRKSTRSRKKKQIYDPFDYANFADIVVDALGDPVQVHESVLQYAYNATDAKITNMNGLMPEQFLPEPQSLKSINRLPERIKQAWLDAFRAELMNLLDKETFLHPTNYKGEKCIPVKAIMKTKLKSDGMVDKLKVRIAIRGDLDKDAIDEDNSAPLASFRLLKVFLCEAARRKKRVFQADFVGAYLQAHMDRVVYVRLPIEYAEFFPDLKAWFGVPLLLSKSAYGINSAGRLWAEELFEWYLQYGFKQSIVDPSLFYYREGDEWIILLSYCDDSAYFASSTETREKFEEAMCKRFHCKILGQIHWFLQARIQQHENFDITLDQSRYAASMCARFLPNENSKNPTVSDRRKYDSPLPRDFQFTKKDCSEKYSQVLHWERIFGFEYASLVGCMLWILNTYARLQFPIRKLAKFMRLPGKKHFLAIYHLLQHVRCHHLMGLTYYSDISTAPVSRLLFEYGIESDMPCTVFCDSSWQDDQDTGRSTGGYHIFCQGGIIESATTLPDPVAMSSAEAEYNNSCVAGMAATATMMLINEIRGLDPDSPIRTPILIDNKAAISMGESFRDTKRTRHILRRYHYVRWMVEKERAVLIWIPGDIQLADPATKNLQATTPTYVLYVAIAETVVKL
jgi:Reverse transcriptase (RNA-dependent DNA polymerase)